MKIRDNRKQWNTDADLLVDGMIVFVESHEHGSPSMVMTLETGYSVILDANDIKTLEKYFTERITKEVMKRMTTKGGKKDG
jgi:hypothetical protein